MSKEKIDLIGSILTGAITGTTVGGWLFQALGVLALAILGAFGGWFFAEYLRPLIKPKLDKIFKKKGK